MLDLGCVPGAWLQVACQNLGPKEKGGLVLGIDIQPPQVPPKYCDDRVKVIQADARTLTPDMLTEYTTDVSKLITGTYGCCSAAVSATMQLIDCHYSLMYSAGHNLTMRSQQACTVIWVHSLCCDVDCRVLMPSCQTCCSSPVVLMMWNCH